MTTSCIYTVFTECLWTGPEQRFFVCLVNSPRSVMCVLQFLTTLSSDAFFSFIDTADQQMFFFKIITIHWTVGAGMPVVWLTSLILILFSGFVRLSLVYLFFCILSLLLSVRVSLSAIRPSFLQVGLWIRVGRVVLDPHQGPVTAGLALALGQGRVQVAATAFEAWWRGAAKPGAGRRSRATCMPEAFGLASEWRMVTLGTHEGQQVGTTRAWCGLKKKKDVSYHECRCCMKTQTVFVQVKMMWRRPEEP